MHYETQFNPRLSTLENTWAYSPAAIANAFDYDRHDIIKAFAQLDKAPPASTKKIKIYRGEHAHNYYDDLRLSWTLDLPTARDRAFEFAKLGSTTEPVVWTSTIPLNQIVYSGDWETDMLVILKSDADPFTSATGAKV